MYPNITEKRAEIIDLCHRHEVRQLDAFDPEDTRFDTLPPPLGPIDACFLVEFKQFKMGFDLRNQLINLQDDLGQLLKCRANVTQRSVIEDSPNRFFREDILNKLEAVYGS